MLYLLLETEHNHAELVNAALLTISSVLMRLTAVEGLLEPYEDAPLVKALEHVRAMTDDLVCLSQELPRGSLLRDRLYPVRPTAKGPDPRPSPQSPEQVTEDEEMEDYCARELVTATLG